MAKSKQSITSLKWPYLGIDRSGSFEDQPPYSTYDAQNVRPAGTLESRLRGGNRPGLLKGYEEDLGGPIRMMNQVTLLGKDAMFRNVVDTFDRNSGMAGYGWSVASWVGTLPGVSKQLDSSLSSSSVVGAVRDATHIDTSSAYSVGTYILPWNGEHHGTYYLYLRMDDTTPVATTDGVVIALTLSGDDGTYSGTVTEYASGTPTESAMTGGSGTYANPGWLTTIIDGDNLKVYWAGTKIFDDDLGTAAGDRCGFGMYTTESWPYGGCLVGTFRAYGTAESVQYAEPRRTYLTAVANGKLYADRTIGQMSEVTGTYADFSTLHPIQSTERTQKLYIADWDDPKVEGTDGTIASSTQLSATSVSDWTDENIDTDNDLVSISNGTGTIVDGVYAISALVEGYLTLSESPGEGTCSYSVQRAPKIYDPATNAVSVWTATEDLGTVPIGCPLICLYRDRVVLAGAPDAPHIWYMSGQGDPLDWDYSNTDSDGATAGQNSDAGLLGQPINAIVPWSDDFLFIGCTFSSYVLRGDPKAGGSIDTLSYEVGVQVRGAACAGPTGEVYFLSQDGLYCCHPGESSYPQKVSVKLPDDLCNVSPERFSVVMGWDQAQGGIHIFITPNFTDAEGQHWFYHMATSSFWRDSLDSDHDPCSGHSFKTEAIEDAAYLLGCRDGYIRRYNEVMGSDDGEDLDSYVMFSPIRLGQNDYHVGRLLEMQGTLATNSGDVDWSVMVGDRNEEAYKGSAFSSGSWSGDGLQASARPHCRGAAAVVRLDNGDLRPWTVERITVKTTSEGRMRV